MTRPHEDIQHHTAVDHRPGGPPVSFAKNAWCAIDVVHVKSDRVGAGISAYETLIEEARKSPTKAGSAVILRAGDDRGVLALVEVGGHDAFKHLQSAWDNHHLLAEHRAVAESSKLALYQVIAITGDCALDPQSKDAYAVEPFPSAPQQVEKLLAGLPGAQGFRGTVLIGTDDGTKSFAIYRFEHAAQIEGLRSAAQPVYPVKTFA
ncbi:MAG: hypothetical protein WCA80_05455 [Candidatus Aquilonibacter sp.]